MQLVRQKPTLKLHQVHHRFKNMTRILSYDNDSHDFCTGSPAPFAGWNSDPGRSPDCSSGAQLFGGYAELGNHRPCFPTSIAKRVRGLGHWICLSSRPVILYIYAPSLRNEHLTQGIPFQSTCTIRTML